MQDFSRKISSLRDLDTDGSIMLKLIVNTIGYGVDWIHEAHDRTVVNFEINLWIL
jgi:hypothetical protein